MGFRQKDIKLLWGKASGLCSICRKQLHVESSSVASGNTLIGENCHIVGDKLDAGPRHKSNLSESDRDRYPNLILLCGDHHTEIDGDEKKYTIEFLHQIKADHEVWAQTALTENVETIGKKLYSNLTNRIVEKLNLNNWENCSDNYLRTLMWDYQVTDMSDINIHLSRIVWPNEIKPLEDEFSELNRVIDKYITHYTLISHMRTEDSWIEDKRRHNDPKTKLPLIGTKEKLDNDYHIHFNNLWNLTVSLNKWSETIRKYLNPEFFLLQGEFIIVDSMGVTNGMNSCVYFPKEYKAI